MFTALDGTKINEFLNWFEEDSARQKIIEHSPYPQIIARLNRQDVNFSKFIEKINVLGQGNDGPYFLSTDFYHAKDKDPVPLLSATYEDLNSALKELIPYVGARHSHYKTGTLRIEIFLTGYVLKHRFKLPWTTRFIQDITLDVIYVSQPSTIIDEIRSNFYKTVFDTIKNRLKLVNP